MAVIHKLQTNGIFILKEICKHVVMRHALKLIRFHNRNAMIDAGISKFAYDSREIQATHNKMHRYILNLYFLPNFSMYRAIFI